MCARVHFGHFGHQEEDGARGGGHCQALAGLWLLGRGFAGGFVARWAKYGLKTSCTREES